MGIGSQGGLGKTRQSDVEYGLNHSTEQREEGCQGTQVPLRQMNRESLFVELSTETLS